MFRAHAANLQVAAVGQLQHAAGAGRGGAGDGPRLGTAQLPAGQLDPADAAVQRGDDTQQAGARRRARHERSQGGGKVAHRVT
ncbi:hypothetical protein D3C84_896520 [compost metagenome]